MVMSLWLMEAFSSADIPQPAKETCRNWFYKTACIRELVPRLYVEMALMKCYNFLENGVIRRVVTRSSGIIRGIGDTLVAGWTRVYLSKVAAQLLPGEKGHLPALLQDYLFTWQQVQPIGEEGSSEDNGSGDGNIDGVPTEHGKMLRSRRITHKEYTRLHRPAFKWIVKELGEEADKGEFKTILKCYRDFCGDGVALKAILDGFDRITGLRVLRVSCNSSRVHL